MEQHACDVITACNELMIGQWISRYFSVETTKHSLALGYGYYWKVQVLSSTTVQVQCLYVAWFSRYRCS